MARTYYRKGQGLSINTIIIAALGLAVLVILFAVFTGRIGIFGKGVDNVGSQVTSCSQQCQVNGYSSGDMNSATCGTDKFRIFGSFSDPNVANNACCCVR